MQTNNPLDKIDVEDLIKDFRVVNIDAFSAYLKEVWRVKIRLKIILYQDLAQRSDDRAKGINKITFFKVIPHYF